MQVERNSVVSLTYQLHDADGNLLEASEQPVVYLHGGYHGIFPRVEAALAGKSVGEGCEVQLEPEDAFGDYDAELVHVEPRDKFPDNVAVGMQFEGQSDGAHETVIYTVTDIAEDKVVVDGNHPLAGQALRFSCTVTEIRGATPEEITHGHVHGPHGHHH